MARFADGGEGAVAAMLEGLVATTPGLSLIREHGVVVRTASLFPSSTTPSASSSTSTPSGRVAVVSGGGSGHEPAMAGYIGEGMLDAAVCGQVFSSPSVEAVLAALRAVTGPAGCLLIVMNYTGDKLNFGLAAQRARLEDLAVEVVFVADDCCQPAAELGVAGRRGLMGTLFVHKVAGAAAAAGGSLPEVAAAARQCAAAVGTMGVALAACTVPGGTEVVRSIPAGHMELGMGIHGEPGVRGAPLAAVGDVAATLLTTITTNYMPHLPGKDVALMVNSLGATPAVELYVAARAAMAWLAGKGITVTHVYVGPFMTALDMAGFSLTLYALDDEARVRALDAPTTAPAWPAQARASAPAFIPAPEAPPGAQPADSTQQRGGAAETAGGMLAEQAIEAVARALLAAEPEITRLDLAVGDGDCGTTLSKGASRLLADLPTMPVDDAVGLSRALARACSVMGGSSGVLYEIFFTAAAERLRRAENDTKGGDGGSRPPNAQRAVLGLAAGLSAMREYGGAKRGDRTMLDALEPALEAAEAAMQGGAGAATAPLDAAMAAAKAAREGAAATAGMRARAGRSSYINPEVLRDHPDPGAIAVATWLEAIAGAVGVKAPEAVASIRKSTAL